MSKPEIEHWDAVVIGGGPAGLMAAGELARAGHRVLVAEAKPSLARKFLMAGKSGLNLTKDESFAALMPHYGAAADWLRPIIAEFDAAAVQNWARALGQPLFTGSTGRVFPEVMKGSPLLRAWLAELESFDVTRGIRWRWTGWDSDALCFQTPDGPRQIAAQCTVLALGGASWARLGSDGAWAEVLRQQGVTVAPFAPSNAALTVPWSAHMQPHFGAALKSVRWHAGDLTSRGEAILSQRGLEGGGLYALTPALRRGRGLIVDLMPDLTIEALQSRVPKDPKKARLSQFLKKTLRLPAAKAALFNEMTARAGPRPLADWVPVIKALPIKDVALRPIDEAISTAGGVTQGALDDGLMLKARPGVFCAGEMLDWEAPTGGYLLTACFATGRWAGRAAVDYLASAITR